VGDHSADSPPTRPAEPEQADLSTEELYRSNNLELPTAYQMDRRQTMHQGMRSTTKKGTELEQSPSEHSVSGEHKDSVAVDGLNSALEHTSTNEKIQRSQGTTLGKTKLLLGPPNDGGLPVEILLPMKPNQHPTHMELQELGAGFRGLSDEQVVPGSQSEPEVETLHPLLPDTPPRRRPRALRERSLRRELLRYRARVVLPRMAWSRSVENMRSTQHDEVDSRESESRESREQVDDDDEYDGTEELDEEQVFDEVQDSDEANESEYPEIEEEGEFGKQEELKEE
jgi:hypothetical protein